MKGTSSCKHLVLSLSVISLVFPFRVLLSPAFAQAPFYQGKTITVIQGREPGGTGDLRARAVTQFLQKYIPGNPTISHEFMAGGGGLRAANHIYAAARPDGLTIGSVSSGLLSSAILGHAGVKYQTDKFHYLGAADAGGHYVFYTRKELGVTSLDKLRTTPGIRIGAQSVGHSNYNIARLLGHLLPMKEARFVTGYSRRLTRPYCAAKSTLDSTRAIASCSAIRNGWTRARWTFMSSSKFHRVTSTHVSVTSPSWSLLRKATKSGS